MMCDVNKWQLRKQRQEREQLPLDVDLVSY